MLHPDVQTHGSSLIILDRKLVAQSRPYADKKVTGAHGCLPMLAGMGG